MIMSANLVFLTLIVRKVESLLFMKTKSRNYQTMKKIQKSKFLNNLYGIFSVIQLSQKDAEGKA